MLPRLLAPAALVGLATLAGCTFPDVTYAPDGGGGGGAGATSSSSTGGCPVSPSCTSAAMSCAKTAGNKHDSCGKQCKNQPPSCQAQCDQDYNGALMMCEAACESCAGCTSVPTACAMAVGL